VCRNLSSVIFEPYSRLLALGESAFCDCFSLTSICLPSSIEVISPGCFPAFVRGPEVLFSPTFAIQRGDRPVPRHPEVAEVELSQMHAGVTAI
jgi:hypothetical protein